MISAGAIIEGAFLIAIGSVMNRNREAMPIRQEPDLEQGSLQGSTIETSSDSDVEKTPLISGPRRGNETQARMTSNTNVTTLFYQSEVQGRTSATPDTNLSTVDQQTFLNSNLIKILDTKPGYNSSTAF